MIGEAIDTALTLGWALIAWIAVLATVGTIALLAAAVTGAWAWRAAWRAVRGAWRGPVAPQGPFEVSRITGHAPEPSQSHTGPPAPSWAHTDKEAA